MVNPTQLSPLLAVRARGPLAVFTLPEFKGERVSAPVMTPSAARGLLEAVLWKPAIRWHVERIRVLNEIRFVSFRRNEVGSKAPRPSAEVLAGSGRYSDFFADDPRNRAQRNTVALRDVDYVVEARLSLTARAGGGETLTKFVEMFQRRIFRGQHWHQPYFGCREFAAEVVPASDAPAPIPVSRSLGRLLLDIDYGRVAKPVFFEALLVNGTLEVPPLAAEGAQ